MHPAEPPVSHRDRLPGHRLEELQPVAQRVCGVDASQAWELTVLVKTFQPELTNQQLQVMDLVNIALSVYVYTQQPRSRTYAVRIVRRDGGTGGICPPFGPVVRLRAAGDVDRDSRASRPAATRR